MREYCDELQQKGLKAHSREGAEFLAGMHKKAESMLGDTGYQYGGQVGGFDDKSQKLFDAAVKRTASTEPKSPEVQRYIDNVIETRGRPTMVYPTTADPLHGYQEGGNVRGMTVEQNIKSVLQIVEKDSEKIELMLNDLLAEFSISHLRKASAITLSGGERRRVEIARALASQPSFLLLDEPLAGIDPISISEVSELISQVKEKNVGVLVTDHNVRDTLNIVERAYIIHNGDIMKSGTPKELSLIHI